MGEIEKIGLTTKEAAEALRVTELTVQELVRSGAIKAVKLGNRGGWRIHPDAIAVWMKAGTLNPEADDESK